MMGFGSLFRSEMRRHGSVLPVSAAMGLIAALSPWLSDSRGGTPAEVRGAVALTVALVWTLALAIGLGATAIGSDLRERRLGFLFRLPVSGTAIGASRFLAGLATIVCAGVLVLVVPLPFGMDLRSASIGFDFLASKSPGHLGIERFDGLLLLVPVALVAAYGIASVASVALAGDRRWLAVDLLSAVVAAGGIWWSWGALDRVFAFDPQWRMMALAGGTAILGLGAVAAWMLHRGRSEPDRARGAMSPPLLLAAAATALVAIVYAAWYLHPGISAVEAAPQANGQRLGEHWTYIEGTPRNRPGLLFRMLRDVRTGRVVALGPVPWGARFATEPRPSVALSANGSRLAWPELAGGRGRWWRLATLDAQEPDARPRYGPLGFRPLELIWALSPQGDRIASIAFIADSYRLLIDDMATGGRLQDLALPIFVYRIHFATPDRVIADGWRRSDDQLLNKLRPFPIDLSTGQVGPPGPPLSLHSKGGPP